MSSTSKADSRSGPASSPSRSNDATRRRTSVSSRNVGVPVSNHHAPNRRSVEQQQDVERVVDAVGAPGAAGALRHGGRTAVGGAGGRVPPPRVAVVPLADGRPIQARQLRAEHRVEVLVRIAADGPLYARIQRDVLEIVQPGEQAHLRELAHPRQEHEPHVRVAALDDRIQLAQFTPGWPGPASRRPSASRIGLSYSSTSTTTCPRPAPRCRSAINWRNAGRRARRRQRQARLGRQLVEQLRQFRVQPLRGGDADRAQVQPHHRMAHRPVPVVVDGQPPEQRLVPLEQFLDGVQQQTLAEPPRAGQEIVLAPSATSCRT